MVTVRGTFVFWTLRDELKDIPPFLHKLVLFQRRVFRSCNTCILDVEMIDHLNLAHIRRAIDYPELYTFELFVFIDLSSKLKQKLFFAKSFESLVVVLSYRLQEVFIKGAESLDQLSLPQSYLYCAS